MQPQSKGDPVIYLPGFASGPGSTKARFFRDRIPHLRILDLAQGDFERLTISGQLGVIERAASGGLSTLIGSSLGGYLAALYASRHAEVTRLVLLAPASAGTGEWRRNGPPEYSAQFAASHANTRLTMLDSDHQLTDALDAIWRETEPFLLG